MDNNEVIRQLVSTSNETEPDHGDVGFEDEEGRCASGAAMLSPTHRTDSHEFAGDAPDGIPRASPLDLELVKQDWTTRRMKWILNTGVDLYDAIFRWVYIFGFFPAAQSKAHEDNATLFSWLFRLFIVWALLNTGFCIYCLYQRWQSYRRVSHLLREGYSHGWPAKAAGLDRGWMLTDQELTSRDWRIARDDVSDELLSYKAKTAQALLSDFPWVFMVLLVTLHVEQRMCDTDGSDSGSHQTWMLLSVLATGITVGNKVFPLFNLLVYMRKAQYTSRLVSAMFEEVKGDLKTSCGASCSPDTRTAVREAFYSAAAQLDRPASLAIFTLTSNHDVEAAVQELEAASAASQVSAMPFVGGTTCQGLIKNNHFESSHMGVDEASKAVGVFLVADPQASLKPKPNPYLHQTLAL